MTGPCGSASSVRVKRCETFLIAVYLETWVQDRVRPDSVQVPGGMLPQCGYPPLSLAWLSYGLHLAGHRAGRGSKGVCPARSSSALLAGD
jgi:hypothetical protein